MSQYVGIHWNEAAIQLVVVNHHIAKSQVEEVHSFPVDHPGDATKLGHQLAEVLAPYVSSRAQFIIGIGRESLNWQHLTLPPCPAEDLPDLVRMQVAQESSNDANDVGFDFLPLSGDEENSHRVWFISLKPFELEKINKVCAAAQIKPSRIIPLSVGYPALVHGSREFGPENVHIFVAPTSSEATLWANHDQETVLFRQLHLPTSAANEELVPAVSAELRRTQLALSQQLPDSNTQSIRLVGLISAHMSDMAQAVGASLSQPISVLDYPNELGQETLPSAETLPLAGLTLRVAEGHAPLADLINPRKRPVTKSRRSTMVLLAAACAAVLALFGWQSYEKLQAPLRDAESAETQIQHLEESLEKYAIAEQKEKAVQEWLGTSANLLTTVEELSQILRPVPLDDESFPVEKDAFLEIFDLSNRQVTIRGAVRNGDRVPPLEAELRKHSQRVQREESEPDQDVPEYPWGYKFIVDIDEPTEQQEQPSS